MFDKSDTVLVIGVGRSGLATAQVLRARGVSVVAYDDKPQAGLVHERQTLARSSVPLIGADELDGALKSATGAVISPGVPSTNQAVRKVQAAGVDVVSEIELAYQLARGPIIAVTGSKGKSTTTALVGHLLRTAGMPARVGGNIGNPLIAETAAAKPDEWIVAEVSSFQLEHIRGFAPRISLLLNISPDHLDRYPSMEEYAEAKYRIFANQRPEDIFIGNADDEFCARLRQGTARPIPCRALWFGRQKGDRGLTVALDSSTLVARIKRREVRLIDTDELRLRGMHNVVNAMAAAAAALSAGVTYEAVREGLKTFAPLPHRLMTVHESGGVTWVDDSKATNPAAATAALQSFANDIILIAGGKGKHTDFSEFAHHAAERAKLVILIGETAKEIGELVGGNRVLYARDLEAAVDAAADAARTGDIVLLSPACASFDMFASAEQRGEYFATLARRHKKKNVATT